MRAMNDTVDQVVGKASVGVRGAVNRWGNGLGFVETD